MSVDANSRQVDGSHYNMNKYQHWDWAIDTKQPYTIAAATKYVARWRDKNGLVDLEKSIHYLEKSTDRNIYMQVDGLTDVMYRRYTYLNSKFSNQLGAEEHEIIRQIMHGNNDTARRLIQKLMLDNSE